MEIADGNIRLFNNRIVFAEFLSEDGTVHDVEIHRGEWVIIFPQGKIINGFYNEYRHPGEIQGAGIQNFDLSSDEDKSKFEDKCREFENKVVNDLVYISKF